MQVVHHNYPLNSSVAATVGSRPSSVASDALRNNTFKIYPNDESDTDRLVTKALVLGDFDSAVSLCLSAERFADAILLAVRGGPELLQRTQKAYFERRTAELPYLRLFPQSATNRSREGRAPGTVALSNSRHLLVRGGSVTTDGGDARPTENDGPGAMVSVDSVEPTERGVG